MEIEDISSELTRIANKVNKQVPNLSWYLFGSVIDQPKKANDIDLLVIYRNKSDPKIVRNGLYEVPPRYPLHITFLSENEEKELKFISHRKMSPIFPKTG